MWISRECVCTTCSGPLGFGVRRATYLIDQARYIRAAVLADFRIGQHKRVHSPRCRLERLRFAPRKCWLNAEG